MNDNTDENVVNELARPEDVLPAVLHLLPLEKKPFFPGQVLPLGGIKEKVIAARRMKIRNLILPTANRGDFEALPDYITKGIKAHFVACYTDVVGHLF